jgi:hypothetical protein
LPGRARRSPIDFGTRLAVDDAVKAVGEVAEHAYFVWCLALGRLLRATSYSYRSFYAPILVRWSDLLFTILDAGVRVLPQPAWEERERRIYWSLRGDSIRIEGNGTLVLPHVAGETLASLLENPALEDATRTTAIARAVVALAELHRLEFTHADATAENVLVDLDGGAAHWFDFETAHDSSRPMAWRRADDVRALLVSCLVRASDRRRADILRQILDAYQDVGVTRLLAASFTSAWQRPLVFHLAQAGLSFRCFREIARLLKERLGE